MLTNSDEMKPNGSDLLVVVIVYQLAIDIGFVVSRRVHDRYMVPLTRGKGYSRHVSVPLRVIDLHLGTAREHVHAEAVTVAVGGVTVIGHGVSGECRPV